MDVVPVDEVSTLTHDENAAIYINAISHNQLPNTNRIIEPG